ncbi:MAG: HlyD family efflux transporter periplasmic adaptor subunit [Candidatus Acidiferrales bacterium]
MKSRTRLRLIIGSLVVVLAGGGIAISLARLRGPERSLPTTRVERGNIDPKIYVTGVLRTPNSASLMAPQVNGTLQIIMLAKTGDFVKPGDVVLQFDPSEQEYNLEQAQSQLNLADQQIAKSKADGSVSTATDQVALLHARYDVRRAELDCSQNELLSAIQGKINNLALEEAKRRLAQLEQDVQSRVASNRAQLAVSQEQRTKALLDIKVAQDHIQSMTIRSTMAGLLTRKGNRNAAGGFGFPGMAIPEFQEGDQTYPGTLVGQVLDVTQMEIFSQVPEVSRADIVAGETIDIQVDADPKKSFPGKVKTVSGMATNSDWWGGDPTRRFDVTFAMDTPNSSLRPGQTAHIVIRGETLKDVLHLPRQAIFMRDGKPVVFVRAGRSFESKPVKIKHSLESQLVVEGLTEGTEVALVDPEGSARPSTGASSSTPAGGKQ